MWQKRQWACGGDVWMAYAHAYLLFPNRQVERLLEVSLVGTLEVNCRQGKSPFF